MDLLSTPFTSGETLSYEETLSSDEAHSDNEALSHEEKLFLTPLTRYQPWSLYQTDEIQIHTFWDILGVETSMTASSCLTDAYAAIQVVDEIISDESLEYWKHRLAYVQLQNILASLDVIILREKRNGHIESRRGHGNNTIKYGILSKALEGRSSANVTRLRVRWSRRWSLIIGGSMLLAIAYSDKAETLVRNFAVTNAALENVQSLAVRAMIDGIGQFANIPL
ncbi:hypothetical protein LEL_08943 [Akanthomyces lecanii RCEF 1005]|uniref:Uncharacterized protein n=1 Tax=Akanthomyces lecanii RCEF 1005 TaxID=1081108 RepID=A0A168CRS0_CORDF|nr:hypothetical protein LEL_08943 [Akanthomyces lecanii RCEF 1005]